MAEDHLLKTWVDRELYERFANLADREQRSLAAELRVAIKAHLEREGKK